MPSLYLRPWRVDVTLRDGTRSPLAVRRIAATAARALTAAGAPSPASVAVILADDGELAALNREHMGGNGPTDVLSFPMLPPAAYPPHTGQAAMDAQARKGADGGFVLPPGRRPHLGDVVISVERAREQAARGRGGQTGDVSWSLEDEMRLLITHGVLHVCGWDHAEAAERDAMRALEKELLASP